MKRIVRTRFPSLYCGWFNSMKNFRQLNPPGYGGRQVAPVQGRRKAAGTRHLFLRIDQRPGIDSRDRKSKLDGFKPSSSPGGLLRVTLQPGR
jgi:hypothetical protein